MEKVIENKIKIIKLAVDYYQLVEILKYTECGNKLKVNMSNKVIKWHENGQLDHRLNYSESKLNGLCEIWYNNGQICFRINYKDDKLNGLYESWYSNGQIQCRANYTEGKLNGICEGWYKSGHRSFRTNYTE